MRRSNALTAPILAVGFHSSFFIRVAMTEVMYNPAMEPVRKK